MLSTCENALHEAKAGLRPIQQLFAELIAEKPGEHRTLVDLGIIARDKLEYELADQIFYWILSENPKYDFAHYELAVSYLLQGDHVRAALAIDRLLSYEPTDQRANLLSARLLYAMGAPSQAEERLARVASTGSGVTSNVIRDFGRYQGRYPFLQSLYYCRTLENSHKFVLPAGAVSIISEAIESQRGFSLVRLGDGEGAFLQLSGQDEYEFRDLYQFNRKDRAHVWFSDELDIGRSGFSDFASGIIEVARRADIVGLPYSNRVIHEYKILSIPGVPSINNLIRLGCSASFAPRICSHDIHLDLHTSGLLPLLASQRSIGLISCQTRLPGILQGRFGCEVEFFKLPGEKGFAASLEKESLEGRHYPDIFHLTLRALEKPLRGKLFLVAGGILGKFYCAKIKEHQGVAIDIGSLADAWCSINTRPGFQSGTFSLV